MAPVEVAYGNIVQSGGQWRVVCVHSVDLDAVCCRLMYSDYPYFPYRLLADFHTVVVICVIPTHIKASFYAIFSEIQLFGYFQN